MSHIVQIKTQIRDRDAVHSACLRMRLPEPVDGPTRLFSSTVTGLAVRLPEWRFPVVCELSTGQLFYDNFNGHWGKITQIDRFIQSYAVEKACLEARRKGHSVTEQALADGSIKLTLQVAGGAA